MRIVTSIAEASASIPAGMGTALTLGVFDGIHLGHQELVRRVVGHAGKRGLVPLVVTFPDHPLTVLAPPYAPRLLVYPDRKARILEDMGVGILALVPFTAELAHRDPVEFAETTLAGQLRARVVVAGYDFAFGKAGAGNADILVELGGRLGFEVDVVDPVSEQAVFVKSTMVRDLLLAGDVEKAARLLSRPYELRGTVVRGFARGRTLGFPTANLEPTPRHLIPARGVYLCAALAAGERTPHGAMVNIGFNPTFGHGKMSVEAHLLDFDGDLTDRELSLFFLARLRDEQKFDGPQALVAQLNRDRLRARELLREAKQAEWLRQFRPLSTPGTGAD